MPVKKYLFLFAVMFLGCKTQKPITSYQSETLQVEQLTQNTFRHISYLQTADFGKVACNGMVVVDQGEALICDTPINDDISKELIYWIENTLQCKIAGVIVTHFHQDCLGGLDEFHIRRIPSYANLKTIQLAKLKGYHMPRTGFENYLEIQVGDKKVVNEFPGEGHTPDNIVCYFPDEKVLFGGCLLKSAGAGKGFLGDANILEWAKTVTSVKSKYGGAAVIIPGHGNTGDIELLDYTIGLFKTE